MKKVLDFCAKYNIFSEGDTVLAAVSGGCDSMCLLHMLAGFSSSLGIKVAAAHFNHRLRGEESDGDESFVRDYCESMGITCYVSGDDVAAYAAANSLGIEEAARELRYAFLSDAAEKAGADKIATAHSADDNLETMLLNLTRGSGLKGLCGIPPVRGNIVRPLLPLSRNEIETYLRANGIPHREDSSNASDDYTRNRLRHHAVPVLREINFAAASAAFSAAELMREDEQYLDSLASEFIEENFKNGKIGTEALLALPYSVSSRVIRNLCSASLGADHVRSVLSLAASTDPSAALSLPGIRLRREYGQIVFGDEDVFSFSPVALTAGKTAVIEELSLRITCKKITVPNIIHKSLTTFTFNCDTLYGNISVRPRAKGDFIRLSEKSGKKTLKKLFTEKKIPALRRDAVPVIADESKVLAVYGLGQDINSFPAPGSEAIEVIVEEIKDIL